MRFSALLFFLLSAYQCLAQEQQAYRLCFEVGSSELSEQHQKDIEAVAALLNEEHFSYLKIFAYATPTGSEADNEKLSQRRAYAVLEEINALHAIDESRFYMTWLGESAEVYDLHYEDAQPQTPCVEVLIQFD